MPLRVTQVVVCTSSSFHFTAAYYSIVYMCPILLIHSPDGHFCYSQVSVTINRATVCIYVSFYLLRAKYLGVRVLGLILRPYHLLHIDLVLPLFDLSLGNILFDAVVNGIIDIFFPADFCWPVGTFPCLYFDRVSKNLAKVSY